MLLGEPLDGTGKRSALRGIFPPGARSAPLARFAACLPASKVTKWLYAPYPTYTAMLTTTRPSKNSTT